MISPVHENTLNMSFSRWREENKIMSAKSNGKNLGMDCKAIKNLSIAQLERNTTWELNPARTAIKRRKGVESHLCYDLPYLHSDSAMLDPSRGPDANGLLVTPRVSAAFARNNPNYLSTFQPAATPGTGPSSMTIADSQMRPIITVGNTPSAPAPAVTTAQQMQGPAYIATPVMGVPSQYGVPYASAHYPATSNGLNDGQTAVQPAMSLTNTGFNVPEMRVAHNVGNQAEGQAHLDPNLLDPELRNSASANFFQYMAYAQDVDQYQFYNTPTAGYYPTPSQDAVGTIQPSSGGWASLLINANILTDVEPAATMPIARDSQQPSSDDGHENYA